MIESLYSNARLYDLMYPEASGASTKVGFYLDLAAAARRPVLELACGTGSMLLPIAAQGPPDGLGRGRVPSFGRGSPATPPMVPSLVAGEVTGPRSG